LQLPDDRLQYALAIRRQVEHIDFVARPQFRICRGSARPEGALEIGGEHLDFFVGGTSRRIMM